MRIALLLAVLGGMAAGTAGYRVAAGDGSGTRQEDLRPGDCVRELRAGQAVTRVRTVACDRPHAWQVAAVVTLPDIPWPGDGVVGPLAEDRCGEAVGRARPDLFGAGAFAVTHLRPTEGSWRDGRRRVTCLVGAVSAGRTVRAQPARPDRFQPRCWDVQEACSLA
jgi:hypothetical protein